MKKIKLKLVLLVAIICISSHAISQTPNCNCDCDVKQYEAITDTVQLDSLFRAEQLTIMELQKEMVFNSDLKADFDCHALKMEVIYKRLEEVKIKIDRP